MGESSGFDWEQFEKDYPGIDPAQVVTPDMLKRRIAWDVVPCEIADAVIRSLNLMPGSQEVADTEHQQSHLRLEGARPLLPYLDNMARYAAEAVVGAMIVSADEGEDHSDERDEAIARLAPVIYMSAWGILAEMLDSEVIHLAHIGYIGGQQ